MRVIERDIWLCEFCLQAAVNDDFSSLDHYYPPGQADKVMGRIKRGLQELGPYLVPDFRDEIELECLDCERVDVQGSWEFRFEDDEQVPVCSCGTLEVRQRDHGEEEFSRKTCDCCGTTLAGYRARFAILGE